MTEVSALRDGDGNFGGGVAGVGEIDGDEPAVGLGAGGSWLFPGREAEPSDE